MHVLKDHAGAVQALAFLPDGRTLVSAGDDRVIRRWDAWKSIRTGAMFGHVESVLSLSVHPDGRLLASCGHDKRVRLWDLDTLDLVRMLPATTSALNMTAFDPQGGMLLYGSDRSRDAVLNQCLLDTFEPAEVPTSQVSIHGVWCLGFSPIGDTFAVGWGNGIVELHGRGGLGVLRTMEHASGVTALAFRPDGTMLATLAGNTVRLWDPASGKLLRSMGEHESRAWTTSWTSDGGCLATGGWDSTVRLWNPETGREKTRYDWRLGRINAVVFAPDGMTAAAAGESGDIVLWDIDPG